MNRESYMKLLEEISLNAWPSHKIELYDGWLIRFSHNYTHRTNSVEQVGASQIPIEEKIAYCEAMYANYHTPAIFKINPLLDPSFDRLLAEKGYEIQHTTEVMTMDMNNMRLKEPLSVEYEYYGRNSGLPSCICFSNDIIIQLRDRITDEWISSLFRLNGTTILHCAELFHPCSRQFQRKPSWLSRKSMAAPLPPALESWTEAMRDFTPSMWTRAAGTKALPAPYAVPFSRRRKKKELPAPISRL